MIIININNSYSTITGLTSKQEKEVRDLLSYTIGSHFSNFGPKRKSLLSRRGEFPTGLLNRVKSYLSPDAYKCIDLRIPLTIATSVRFFEEFQPYEFQNKAVKEALHHSRGIISAVTGSGKSLIIALIASRLNVRTLVVVPSLEIKRQLLQTLQSVLNDTSNITVENIDSTALQARKAYDCLIIDEGHHAAAKTYQKLNKTQWADIYYRFFLTATPFRNDTEETLLFEGIAGEVIFEYTYKQAVKDKVIVPIEAYVYNVPKQATEAFTWQQVYSELVVNNKARNELIALLMLRLNAAGKSNLCLVKEIAHGQILADLTGLPFVHGQDDESRDYIHQFNNGVISGLIGTTGIMGEGVDTKPCEYVLIAGLGKAKSQFMQQVGRAVRVYQHKESAKIILFLDKSHKFSSRHYYAQRSILKEEYGIVAIKLEIDK